MEIKVCISITIMIQQIYIKGGVSFQKCVSSTRSIIEEGYHMYLMDNQADWYDLKCA